MPYLHLNHLGDWNLATDGSGVASISAVPGLRLCGQRLYDPGLGRFLMPDALIPNIYEPQSHNPYSYCHNDPVNYIDPSGHYRRVPRIFPEGEMPGHATLQALRLGTTLAEYLASLTCGYNNLFGAILLWDIVFNSMMPTLLAPDADTLTRGQTIKRVGMDFLFHVFALGIGQAAGKYWLRNPLGWVEEYIVGKTGISIALLHRGSNLLGTVVFTGLAHSCPGQATDIIRALGVGVDIGINFQNVQYVERLQETETDEYVFQWDGEKWV